MGVIRRGLLGGFSGRVGNIVGSSWKGIAVIKSLPLSVANPQTTGQVTQRNKFTNTVDFSTSALSAWIKPLWDRFASQMSGYNAFVSTNVRRIGETFTYLGQNFQMSAGKMDEVQSIDANWLLGPQQIEVSWDSSLHGSYETADDQILICLAYEDMPGLLTFDTTSKRSDGSTNIMPMSGSDLNKKVGVAVACRRPDGTVVSDSFFHDFTLL